MIPKGWEQIRLAEATKKIGSGITPRGGEAAYKTSGYPLIRSQNVGWGRLLLENVSFIDIEQHDAMSGTKLKRGDVLLNITGASIGRVATFEGEDRSANVNQHVCIIRSNGKLEPRFLEAYLLSEYGQKQVDQFQAGGNRQGLNFKQVATFRLPLPPLPEQKRIAEILSTWDRAIETTEKLIANSEAQKKALMQQLVSGEMRFPEISAEPWNEQNLKDVASIIVSNVDKKTVDDEQPVRLCNYMDVYANDVVHPDLPYMSATATAAQVRKFGLRVGDVLITKDSETPDDIAVPTYVERTADDLVCGYHLAIVRPKKGVSGRFLKYFFENPRTQYYFASRANGATRFGLTIGAIEDAPIQLPPLPEQEKIASAIAGSEREARVLASSLNALLTEKKALMQQLLTGKRRVKLPEKIHA
jgi:type I restriction enzyme S subunit